MMLQNTITKSIAELGNTALEINDPVDFKQEVLMQLQTLLRAPDSLFLDWTPRINERRNWKSSDIYLPNWEENYGKGYCKTFSQDPVYMWISSGHYKKDWGVTRFSELVNFHDIKKTQLYSKFMQPIGHRYVLTIVLNDGANVIGNISLLRNSSSNNFSKSDIQIAQLVKPILIGAYKKLLLQNQINLQSDMLDIVASHNQKSAILILSPTLKIIYNSEKTKELSSIILKNGFSDIQEFLYSSDSIAEYLEMYAASYNAATTRLPYQLTETIKINDELTIQAKVGTREISNDKHYLVINLETSNTETPSSNFKSRFGLSMRELQVAQLASEGLSSQEMSEQLCISPWSIKNHLKNIYKKTGVNNRTALSRLCN